MRTLPAGALTLFRILDWPLAPLTALAALLLRAVRTVGLQRLPVCRGALMRVGLLPVRAHYYEPMVRPGDLTAPLDRERALPGIDLRVDEQLALLASFTAAAELAELARTPAPAGGGAPRFRFDNGAFDAGDAEVLYQLIRRLRPARLVEIGSGWSTLIARAAIDRNRADDAGYDCDHVCVEPFEHPWLAGVDGLRVVRERVENVDRALFAALGADDILFIDSSHVIRPQGDVLCEYLELLPALAPGVLVHVHDVFTPRDYPRDVVVERARLWNEQYLLEAFLSCNDRFEVVLAVNLLARDYPDALAAACPVFARARGGEPGSFWIRRR